MPWMGQIKALGGLASLKCDILSISVYSTRINFWGNFNMLGAIFVYYRNPEASKANMQFIGGRTEQLLFSTIVLNVRAECGP